MGPHMEGSGVSNPYIYIGFEGPRAVWSVWVVMLYGFSDVCLDMSCSKNRTNLFLICSFGYGKTNVKPTVCMPCGPYAVFVSVLTIQHDRALE